jgi:hypothetical protein
MCDEWEGGAFVEGPPAPDGTARAAILLAGVKGLGDNCYDEPPVTCDDPCSQSHGYHCAPYERQILLYDVTELGEARLAGRDPWTILPYAVWRPTELYLQGNACWTLGGLTFDPAARRLYLVERGLGESEQNAAVVHVWTVGG